MNRHARTLTRGALAVAMMAGVALTATPAEAATNSAPNWFVVAHRGGSNATPESTLAAFQHMIDIRVNGVEFDVRMTKDGVPVVLHDSTLNRTTNCSGSVSKITYARLQKCDAGSWFGSKFRGQRVPSLSTALAFIQARTTSNFTVFTHVKVGGSTNAKKIMAVVKKRGMSSRVVTIADSPTTLKPLKSAGAKRQGLVFNSPSGFSSGYKYLIPYNVTVNSSVIQRAHSRNQIVLPVESHPFKLPTLADFLVDGVLANNIDQAIALTGRAIQLAPPPKPATTQAPPPASATEQQPPPPPAPTCTPPAADGTSAPNDSNPPPCAPPASGEAQMQTTSTKSHTDTNQPIRTTGPNDM